MSPSPVGPVFNRVLYRGEHLPPQLTGLPAHTASPRRPSTSLARGLSLPLLTLLHPPPPLLLLCLVHPLRTLSNKLRMTTLLIMVPSPPLSLPWTAVRSSGDWTILMTRKSSALKTTRLECFSSNPLSSYQLNQNLLYIFSLFIPLNNLLSLVCFNYASVCDNHKSKRLVEFGSRRPHQCFLLSFHSNV